MKSQEFKNYGKNSVQIGKARDVNVHINDTKEYFNLPNYRRKIKLKLGIKPNQISFISGIAILLGIISSIITIVGLIKEWNLQFIKSNSLLFALLFPLGFLFLVFGLRLKRTGFLKMIPVLVNSFIEVINGRVVITRISSECPECGAKMSIIGGNGSFRAYCNRNNDHNFNFDYTKLD